MKIKNYIISIILLAVSSLAIAENDANQVAVDNQSQPNTSAVRKISAGSSIVTVTCTDGEGKSQNVKIQGMAENTVIVNCKTDTQGNAHITVKGDGASREIGIVKIQGDAENVLIVNTHQLNQKSKIVVEGKDAKVSMGNVEVKGNKLNNTAVINNTTIHGGKIEAKGDGASVSVGTVIIGN